MKILKFIDGFLIGVVTEKAKEIFNSGLFELYEVHEQTESLIETMDELNAALERGASVCIELGFIDNIQHLPQ
jgi:hypothetical protein